MQVLVVGDHRLGVGPAEIVVPDAEQRQDDRHIAFRRRLDEMLVHRVGAGQQLRRNDQARSPARSAGRSRTTANNVRRPIPRTRTCSAGRSRTDHRLAVGRHGNEVARYRHWSCSAARHQALAESALVDVSCVVKVLEAITNRVVAGSRPLSVSTSWGAVDIGHEMHPQIM